MSAMIAALFDGDLRVTY